MPKIQCLDQHVADLIAAGEVVERPASAVKELVENAIDAGSTSIEIEIQRGGMAYIRVSDNGCGISSEDAETAFLRHATSKVRNASDLYAIGTLGFRGEALAAICAVSKIELQTRTADEDFGTQLFLDGGVKQSRQEYGCPVGTTIIVRDLFFNTPARLKFVKRDTTESANVFSIVQHIALSHPEISFKFIRDGRQDLLTAGDGSLKSAIYTILGRDMLLGMLPCHCEKDGLKVSGYISRPSCCRGSRNYQYFFVNGRYVKHKTMMAALEEAYNNSKMIGKFPACVLHLTSELEDVDVNVHPTKMEVKFTSDKELFALVYKAVIEALTLERGHPNMVSVEPDNSKNFNANSDYNSVNNIVNNNVDDGNYYDDGFNSIENLESYAPPETMPVQNAVQEFSNSQSDNNISQAVSQPVEYKPITPKKFTEWLPDNEFSDYNDCEITEYSSSRDDLPPEQISKPVHKTLEQKQDIQNIAENTENISFENASENNVPQWTILGEAFRTYIIVQQGEKILFIDKHAAHERMNFDRLKAQDYKPLKQILLTPIVLKMTPELCNVLLSQTELLDNFGFEIEDFGKNTIIVRQIPDYLSIDDVESTLGELADKILLTGTADPNAVRDEALHTFACKSAIKGGWINAEEELSIVTENVMNGNVKYCPHGRPVAVEMTRKQLEKLFKRIV